MLSPSRIVVGLAALLGLLQSCSSVQPPHCAEGVELEIPCASAYDDIERVETDGEACGTAGLDSYGYSEWKVRVSGAAEGTCRFTLVMRSGSRLEFTAEFQESCADRFYGKVTSPIPQLCPDAGPCPGQTGCFVDPVLSFDPRHSVGQCSLGCAPENGLSCSTKVMGAKPGECDEGCACGGIGYSFIDGCKADSDCVLSPADCCGCARGGTSWAVLASHQSKWDYNRCASRDAGCNAADNRCTPGATAICENGRCLVGPRDGGL